MRRAKASAPKAARPTVECPVCGTTVSLSLVNEHLDRCGKQPSLHPPPKPTHGRKRKHEGLEEGRKEGGTRIEEHEEDGEDVRACGGKSARARPATFPALGHVPDTPLWAEASPPAEDQRLLLVLQHLAQQRGGDHGRCTLTHLTDDGRSWVLHCPRMLCSNPGAFDRLWAQHPDQLGTVVILGKQAQTPRYTRAFGQSYSYSGVRAIAHPLSDCPAAQHMVGVANALADGARLGLPRYSMCLVNWYEPEHSIGAHSDDVRQLVPNAPIFSVSWGCERTFRFTARKVNREVPPGVTERFALALGDGDVVVMGGACQRTHKHEVPKSKAVVSRRINFTMRCFKDQGNVRE